MCATFSNDDVGKSVVNGNGEAVGVVASVEGDVAHVRPETAAVDSVKSSIGWEGVADAAHPLDTDSVREITDDAVRLEGELPSVDRQELEAAVDSNTGDDAGEERTEPAGGSAGTEETEIAEDLRDETGEDTLEETDAIDERETTAPDEPETGRDRASDRGLEADPTELARQEREGGTRAGASVEPTDDFESTDAAVDPDAELESTDAAVDRDDDFESTDAAVDRTGEPRRTDAAVDPGEQPRGADVDPTPDPDRDAEAERGGPTTEDAGKTDLEDDLETERLSDRSEDEDEDADGDRRRD
ncbi:hypothetical protein HTZ84_20845 [Haloterrigena sp. SYSU A558-1]|uniref:PRC-barrel domain-containing protein n=1 Tax=Haloterrigena gelatinilytica TaxID=2741724 RepID=A0ABX2LH66_9EURY|nr:hypothetical protein [Haloterrigena gelatinilytica]NUC74713.1 hypothetical protein [Haloterrigena gelatinilytica]